MFCYQCQETNKNIGCKVKGVCGKTNEVSNLQDLLIYVTKGLAYNLRYNELTRELSQLINDNLFITITNANFSKEDILRSINYTMQINRSFNKKGDKDACLYYEVDEEKILKKSEEVGVLLTEDEDIRSLKELITYGLKGIAAYNHHANVLGFSSNEVNQFIQNALSSLLDQKSMEDLINLTLKTGEYGVRVMELLDEANTKTYGNPEITEVNIGVGERPGILISGHDLKDMQMLLEQSEGSGVDIYTHSEMLPANYYPKFKKYKHFVGNYGNAWHKQRDEFEKFNGPILMTTNCIVPPKSSYIDRIFTTGVAGYEGVKHIKSDENGYKDFSEIIELAKKSKNPTELEKGNIIGGFAHNQVIELGDKVVEAIKNGLIKKFVVMAGCDGRSTKRNYYEDFAKSLPNDTIILTAGCAKYRYNKLNLGDIGGIPRVLDAGQCNDSYSLIKIALTLQEIFKLNNVNELPIVFNIAWYEQKAVIVLLSLLFLGIKNIKLGPTLPAFLSKNVVKFLIDTFNINTITTVEEDLKQFELIKREV